jgi:uncharacterized protein (DUF983 family)
MKREILCPKCGEEMFRDWELENDLCDYCSDEIEKERAAEFREEEES